MAGSDGVFHVAAWYRVGSGDAREAVRANVDGTRMVLEAMRDLSIAKGVYTSTLAVFGDTRGRVVDETYRPSGSFATVYDETKWRAHFEVALPLMAAGLPLVIVQPGLVYGAHDHGPARPLLDMYLERRLPAVPASAYCWGHVEDTALAHRLAMERGRQGQAYIVAGPPHPLADALAIAERLTGIPAPRLRIPRFVTSALRYVPGTAAEALRVLGATYLGSNAKARRELGFDPRPLRDGFAEVLPLHIAELAARPA
jgi:nucleoside-diphosphate-sugar epimerase